MSLLSKRSYQGPVGLAIFDWAGTTVDYGCCAPVTAFVEVFRQQGINITIPEARGPMGMGKRDHIEAIAKMERVAKAWHQKFGRSINDTDIDHMFESFIPQLLDILAEKSDVIPGVVETVQRLRAQGLKIGASTGYFKEAADIVARTSAAQGYSPDYCVSATEVDGGRPCPWMIFRVMEKLRVYPPQAVVNIGDTVVDIQAALNAGSWAVGVTQTGNLCGLSIDEMEKLPDRDIEEKTVMAEQKLINAGAHYVVKDVTEIPEVVEAINGRLERGETPHTAHVSITRQSR